MSGENQTPALYAEQHHTNWTCLLSRDLVLEIDETLPRSNLSQLEDLFCLPLPCDEADNKERPPHVNAHFVFFLAEMSLRAILERILSSPNLNSCIVRGNTASIQEPLQLTISPVQQELRSQLDTWTLRLPASLGWSFDPVPVPTKTYGERAALMTRLKLLYWYARFALHRPIMLQAWKDEATWSRLLTWEHFREGLLQALILLKIYAIEQPDIDVIMANRYVLQSNSEDTILLQ